MPRYSPRTGLLQEYQVGPYSSSHLYIQWGGLLPGGERWSCGFRLLNEGTVRSDAQKISDAASLLTSYANEIQSFHEHALTQISSAAKLSFVKCNMIKTDGEYGNPTTNESVLADLGGAGAGNHPNQIALAISLTTGFSRGPAHRGRFFIPLPAMDALSDGKISAALRDNVETSATNLLTGVNLVSPTTWKMAVFSRKAGAAAAKVVTGIEVGRILDTQRRRRSALVESY